MPETVERAQVKFNLSGGERMTIYWDIVAPITEDKIRGLILEQWKIEGPLIFTMDDGRVVSFSMAQVSSMEVVVVKTLP